jgi:diketogulonate reductase-like aldo/keto reductase
MSVGSHPPGIPLSTKATDPTYIAQDIDLFDWELSAEEMQTLSAATKPSGVGPNVACLM